jgi:hypothetical protein
MTMISTVVPLRQAEAVEGRATDGRARPGRSGTAMLRRAWLRPGSVRSRCSGSSYVTVAPSTWVAAFASQLLRHPLPTVQARGTTRNAARERLLGSPVPSRKTGLRQSAFPAYPILLDGRGATRLPAAEECQREG